MAFTVTRTNSVAGNEGMVHLHIVADAATQNVATGLKRIVGYAYGPSSMNSSNIHIAVNSGAGATAIAGMLGISGCTSGDDFYVTVFGPR